MKCTLYLSAGGIVNCHVDQEAADATLEVCVHDYDFGNTPEEKLSTDEEGNKYIEQDWTPLYPLLDA